MDQLIGTVNADFLLFDLIDLNHVFHGVKPQS